MSTASTGWHDMSIFLSKFDRFYRSVDPVDASREYVEKAMENRQVPSIGRSARRERDTLPFFPPLSAAGDR
jgi:hypothetical protein